jgi:hypothetical protein
LRSPFSLERYWVRGRGGAQDDNMRSTDTKSVLAGQGIVE